VQGPLRVVAMLPIITPPFVVGLGLILLFGRAGIVNQFLEYAFGIPPTRWFYGCPRHPGSRRLFAFTPIAFMIMRGVVQGVAPSLEEAAQTLRADRKQTFFTVTLPLLKPGLANAFLVGFIESMADFGNPIVVGGQFSVLSTDIFFAIVGAQYDQGRAAIAGLDPHAVRATACLPCSAACSASRTTPRCQRQGRLRHPHAAARQCAPPAERRGLPVAGLHAGGVPVCFASGGFVQTWGRDYTITLNHFHSTAFSLEWGQFGIVWAGTAWNSFFTTIKLSGHLGTADGRSRPADRLAAGAHRIPGPGHVRVRRPCWRSRSPAPCWA
jgi:iron(III) transport system permease protein